jgi:hypothetical protein
VKEKLKGSERDNTLTAESTGKQNFCPFNFQAKRSLELCSLATAGTQELPFNFLSIPIF